MKKTIWIIIVVVSIIFIGGMVVYLTQRGKTTNDAIGVSPSQTASKLTASVLYAKSEDFPKQLKGLLPENVIDSFVVTFSNNLGSSVDKISGEDLMNIKTISVPKLSTEDTNDILDIPISRTRVMANEYVIWSGSDADSSKNISYENLVIFSANKDVIVGSYFSTRGNYNIEYVENGQYLVYRTTSPLGEYDDPHLKEEYLKKSISNNISTKSPLPTVTELDPTTGPHQIDVMFVYTNNALQQAGGNENVFRARAILSIAHMNQAIVHSPPLNDPQYYTFLNIVHFMKVNYQESQDYALNLDRLKGNSDGYMDEIHVGRASSGSDLVVLAIADDPNNPVKGVARYAITAENGFSVVSQIYVGDATFPSVAHEIGHNFGAGHLYPSVPSALFPYGNAYSQGFPGETLRLVSINGYLLEIDDYYHLAYSTPGLIIVHNNIQYPFGSYENEYNAAVIAMRAPFIADFSSAPNGGGGYTPPGPVSNLCDVWRVTCNDNQKFLESSCDTQRLFNNTWHNSWPGGGYGRWQYEACQAHGGASLNNCPNVQQDPIKWCVTMDCPNGDTNGDSRCTTADQGANTQDYRQGAFCPYPQSGQGDVNIYSGDTNQINWQTYCGTTYKYLVSSNPDITCNPDNVVMRVNPNPANPGQGVTFSLDGSSEGDTWIEDYWSGGFNCSGNVAPGQPKTCTASTNGTYTWTHKWKKCIGSANNCSNLCAKTATFVVSNPIPTATPTPVVNPPSGIPGIEIKQTGTTVEIKQAYPRANNATKYYVERCQGVSCTNFAQVGVINNPDYLLNNTIPNAANVYRYRLRGWNSGGYGLYSQIVNSSVTWTFTLKPVCSNGQLPNSTTYSTIGEHTLWPPVPVQWQYTAPKVGQHTLNIKSYDSVNWVYLRLRDEQTGEKLTLRGNPPHSAIQYGTYFTSQAPAAKVNRNTLPPGNYTIQYNATQCP